MAAEGNRIRRILNGRTQAQSALELTPYATCWFGTNHMPHTRDFSNALFRRALILSFNNVFEGAACDPHLQDNWRSCRASFAWALQPLRESFSGEVSPAPPSSVAGAQEWRKEADHVAQFVDERLANSAQRSRSIARRYSGATSIGRTAQG